jgi:hypothetical protein
VKVDPAAAVLQIDATGVDRRGLPAIPLGRPLAATVTAALTGGRWMLEIEGRGVAVKSAVEMTVGEQVLLVASRTPAGINLRMLASAARLDPAQYAAAILAGAGARPGPAPAFPSSPQLLEWLAACAADVSGTVIPSTNLATVASQLTKLMAPLDHRQSAEAMAEALEGFVEQGGLFLERRLRSLLEPRTVTPPALLSRTDVDLSTSIDAGDIRVLLASVRRALQSANRGAPLGDAAAGPNAGELSAAGAATIASGAGTAILDRERQALVASALARQLDLAYQWLRHGWVRLELPLALGDAIVMADLCIEVDSSRRPRGGSQRAFAFDLQVELAGLGRLAALVQWVGRELSASVLVDGPELQTLVRSQLGLLTEGLQRAGFTRVTTSVKVDPVALAGRRAADDDAHGADAHIFTARV